jgi:hypothetical protein
MPAARYWRLEMQGRPSAITYCGELILRTVAGGAQAATGGTPISSADYAGFAKANAFDGNPSTLWLPSNGANVSGWIGYDFGAGHERDIVEVAVDLTGHLAESTPEHMRMAYSLDGANWTPVYPIVRPPQELAVFTFAVSASSDTTPPKARGQAGRINPGWPSPSALQVRGRGRGVRPDKEDGGAYHLAGTVKVDGSPDLPVSRRVWLFDHDGGRLVREQWSDPGTGAYDFTHIALKPYFVVAFDHTHNFRAVIADRVLPEPMTT